ncbi:MAG: repair protein SbcC/Rad50 [Actinomycetota bacterium]|nr:repair protein SbcC/Rad50 [Actinomycetota bacterium]
MIRHISLENWRAYRSLDIDVLPGTTFLVAPNGVGKSSLLEAVRWVLAAGNVEHRASMIRQGHKEATAAVTVDVASGQLVVARALRAKGARLTTETTATLDGHDVAPEEAVRLLEDSWSADPRFVSRTAFLTEDLRRDAEEPNLRTHLCRAYSLDDLQRAVAEIEPVLSQLSKGLKASRAELSATEEQLRTAEEERAASAERAVAAAEAVATTRAAHTEARAVLDQARAAASQRAAAAAWRERDERLRDEAATIGLVPEAGAPLAATLAAVEDDLAARVESIRQQQAALRARVEAAESALAALLEAGATCPVCLRQLDDDSRERAEHLHRTGVEVASDVLADLDQSTAAVTLDAVRQLARRAASLGTPPEAPEADGLDELVEAEATAQAALETAVGGLREAQLQEQAVGARVAAIRTDLATAGALTEQYRAEALLEAAKSALNQTITTVLGRQLEPVAAEVNRRWEAVFPDRPNLHVLPDGQMSRVIDGDQLEFGAFSAGEQTVAKLMMRLTTLLATTTVPFCWVDEPLEHLDPISRQLVGSTLAHLSAAGGLEQIFVTTYEEPLARRLAELQPDRVRVQYLRTEPSR